MSVLTLSLGKFRSVANLVNSSVLKGQNSRSWENLQVVKSQNNVPSLHKNIKNGQWQLFPLWTSTDRQLPRRILTSICTYSANFRIL